MCSSRLARVLTAIFIIAHFTQTIIATRMESDTWDEGLAIASDVLRIYRQDWSIADYTPPLHTWLNRPGLLIARPSIPPQTSENMISESFYGNQILFRYNDASTVLFVCRLSIIFVTCLMAIVLCIWAARLGGPWAGTWASFLMATEPNLLAHGRLATWDMLCTSTMFIASYAIWSWLRNPKWRQAVFCGVTLGVALISKFTALILLPSILSGILLYDLTDPNRKNPIWRDSVLIRYYKHILIITGMSFLVVILSYAPDIGYRHYLKGISLVYFSGIPSVGHYLYYLMGRFYPEPLSYYYLVTVLLKTPIPVLISLVIVLASPKRYGLSSNHLLYILMPITWILLTSGFDAYNVCNRRILPIYPFVLLIASQLLSAPYSISKISISALLSLWLVTSAIHVYPHHLSYFNEIAGGSTAGYQSLDECNVDWGQGYLHLSKYLQGNGIHEVRIPEEDAQGPFRMKYYGIRYQPVTREEYISPHKSIYIISGHRLIWLRKQSIRLHDTRWNWMDRFTPDHQVGYGLFVFDFRL